VYLCAKRPIRSCLVVGLSSAALLLAFGGCADDTPPRVGSVSPSGGEDDAGDEPDAAVEVDAAVGEDAGVDAAEPVTETPIGDGNCTGAVFQLESVRSAGSRLSLLVDDEGAHLVYPTPACGGTSARANAQALSYVSLGLAGAPSAPQPIVNGESCAVTRDPVLYRDEDGLHVSYTTNALGSYDLCSATVNGSQSQGTQLTSAPGTELHTAVLELDGTPRTFFSREPSTGASDAVSPIVGLADGAEQSLFPSDTHMHATDLVASPLLDGTSLGAIGFPSQTGSEKGMYLALVRADGSPVGSATLLTKDLGSASAIALASNDDGGAVIYSEVPGGTAHQLRFRAIDHLGALGTPASLTVGNQDLRDLALAPFHGGYLAAYRRTSAGDGGTGTMRLLFVDEVGNVKMTGYVAEASMSAGTTQLGVAADDNTFFVAWSNVESVTTEGVSSVVEHVSLARFSCTRVPKLTCDK
jgi:hypothetical protein